MRKLSLTLGFFSAFFFFSSVYAQNTGTFKYGSGVKSNSPGAYSSYLSSNDPQHQLRMSLIAQAGANQAAYNRERYGAGNLSGPGKPYTLNGKLKSWRR